MNAKVSREKRVAVAGWLIELANIIRGAQVASGAATAAASRAGFVAGQTISRTPTEQKGEARDINIEY